MNRKKISQNHTEITSKGEVLFWEAILDGEAI
jgi:hypothetical protein